MPAKAKRPNPAAVDAWLARLPQDQRTALERLRGQIRAAAPEAVETVGYGIPMYYVGTTPLVGFNVAQNHVALTVASGTLFGSMRAELEGYDTAKGTVRFTPDRPLPATLVEKLVKARLAEQAAGKTVR